MTRGNDAGLLLQMAVAAHQSGNYAEAERCCRAVLDLNPDQFDTIHILALVHFERGQYASAAGLLERAQTAQPEHAGIADLHGMALAALGRPADAIVSYDRAIAIAPGLAEAYFHRGNALAESARDKDAVASFSHAAAIKPQYWQALYNCGLALLRLKRPGEALLRLDATLVLQPDFAPAHNNRGAALMELDRAREAIVSFDHAIALAPGTAEAFSNRGNAHFALLQHGKALADYDRAIALGLRKPFLQGARLHASMHVCDWRNFADDCAALLARIEQGEPAAAPFVILPIASGPAAQRRCAEIFVAHEHPAQQPLWRGERYDHDRIRLAYVSSAFRHHPTAVLVGGLFERHDTSRFETFAISFSPDDASPARRRMESGVQKFLEMRGRSDHEIAGLMRELEIDIAVDLDGFILGSRPGIFALRPAPIQVSYLGFPATMGSSYMDYMIADRIVAPPGQRHHFQEKIVYLPDSYQPNSNRAEPGTPPSRRACGLPPEAFVFCCFNSSYKITPDIFDVWMRLLQRAPASVLWLLEPGALARANLLHAAKTHGIAETRLIFAPIASLEENLARQQLADLFLDTPFYNAHTTASDALWAGLPLITCAGESFAGRVAASLLAAAGLPELVTPNLMAYEALALDLAGNAALLEKLKQKLRDNRTRCALFDPGLTANRLEMAFETMSRRLQEGLPPESFCVPPAAGS